MRTNTMGKINKILVKSIFLILCSLISLSVDGQVREVKNAPSAEVANLGTFGTVPVGLYTGTPNVSVPIYTIKFGHITLPIEAKYHLSNVKPHTPPSCLGIGWALSAGGYIARTVKGCQDEKETYSTKAGYYFNHGKVDQIEKSTNKSQKLTDLTHLSGNDWYELAADEFYFSFNGYSGTFFMDKDGQWRVISDDNIKVEFNESNGFKTIDDLKKRFSLQLYAVSLNKRFFDKFTLITPDGTRYEFGGNNATEYSVPYYNQVNGDIMSTCWRLSKITTIDKRVVNFEYAADSYMCDIHYGPQIIYSYVNNKGVGMQNNCNRTGYTGFLTMPSRLLKIKCDDEVVTFNYKRDYAYGNLFQYNSGCLYWKQKINGMYDENTRYGYGYMDYEFSNNKFSLFLGIRPLQTEYDTRDAIAKKITQDYLTNISFQKAGSKLLDVKFIMSSVRNRRLLNSIQFCPTDVGKVNLGTQIDFENIEIADFGDKVIIKGDNNLTGNTSLTGTLLSNTSANNIKNSGAIEIGKNSISLSSLDTQKNEGSLLANSNELSKNRGDDFISVMEATKEYEYKFDYYTNSDQEKLWPIRNPLTFTDSWGYYSRNGYNPMNKGEWQLAHSFVTSDFAVRLPSFNDTRIFTLKNITYPTGGKTEFQYESHDYSKQFNIQKNTVENKSGLAGGLRIKVLLNYDTDGALLYSKNYSYKQTIGSSISSGVSKGAPCFYDRIFFNSKKSNFIEFYSFENMSLYPMNFNTPDVGYSTVFEDIKDKNGKVISRTKYQFSNYDTDNYAHSDKIADYNANVWGTYGSASFTSMAFERGKLVLKEIMDAGNQVLEKIMLSYVRSVGNPYSTIAQAWHLDYYQNLFAYSYLYKTYTNRYLASVIKTQQIMANGTYTDVKKCYYNSYGLLSKEDLVSNNGESVATTYKYSFDESTYSWMKDKNILLPTMTSKSKNGYTDSEETFYSATLLGVPYIYKKASIRTVSNKSETSVDFTVERVDKYGNPIVYIDHGVETIMIWSHTGMKLVATIQNASYEEVKNALGRTPEDVSEMPRPSMPLDILRSKLSNALVYTYEYDNRLNLIGKTEPNGLIHLYFYDGADRLVQEQRKYDNKLETLKTYKYNYVTNN